MIDIVRYIQLRFEIQHLFPTQIRTNVSDPNAVIANQFLADVGFNLESSGNKMALLASPDMRDALRNTPPSVQQAFVDAGFNWNIQNSAVGSLGGPSTPDAHPNYNRFIIDTLAGLSNEADFAGWDTTARERAAQGFASA